MRWDPTHQSDDVIDKRGESGPGIAGGTGLLWLLLRFKYGWVAVLAIVGFLAIRGVFSGSDASPGVTHTLSSDQKDTQAHFAAFVLDDAQQYWQDQMESAGRTYTHAKLVLFTDATQTGCGYGQTATGPFYCPNDQRVYIDLGFFRTLSGRLGAKGEFARAYVIAHELGHHVQNVMGTMDRTQRGGAAGASGATGYSVRLELQADCYAGVWAHSAKARNLLENGDIESALGAASRIGDDTLQKEETGRVRPETFTHGTAEQRHEWLKRGFDTGSARECDTFKANVL